MVRCDENGKRRRERLDDRPWFVLAKYVIPAATAIVAATGAVVYKDTTVTKDIEALRGAVLYRFERNEKEIRDNTESTKLNSQAITAMTRTMAVATSEITGVKHAIDRLATQIERLNRGER